jgi:DNA polymerase III subunit delta
LKLTPDTLAQQLATKLLPAYLVSGDEPLLTQEAADAVRAAARRAGCEREVHFIERAVDWEAVRAASANLSLFATRRLTEIRLATGKPGTAGAAALSALLESVGSDTHYLILAPRLDREARNAPWLRALESIGAALQVWPLEPARLPAWLRGRAKALGIELDADALALLAARTEGNLLAAQQELDKLALAGVRGSVGAEALLAVIADSARFDVFQLSEALLEGATARALRMLAGLRAEGTEPVLVLWACTKALRDTWNAHAHAGEARAPVWQRQAAALEQARRRAPRLSFRTLLQRAARTDRMIKGRLTGDPWDEMALLATELCGAARAPFALAG